MKIDEGDPGAGSTQCTHYTLLRSYTASGAVQGVQKCKCILPQEKPSCSTEVPSALVGVSTVGLSTVLHVSIESYAHKTQIYANKPAELSMD